MSQNMIETVRLELKRVDHLAATPKVAKAAILATLDAIREPSAEIIEIGAQAYCKDFGNQPREALIEMAGKVIVLNRSLATAYRAMIDALRAEIESAGQ
jgi:hypothetical protein